MAKVATVQTNFTGGELSPRLDGRVDITKHKNGCRVIENMTVIPHGGARKRSGTKFVVEQKSTSDDVVLVPFVYNAEQAYVLIFGPSYVWFVKDGGIITHAAVNITGITKANPAVVSATNTYSNGDRVIITGVSGMTEVNNRQFVVANASGSSFELQGVDSSSYGTYSSGGTSAEIVELTTTYTADQLDELRFTQTNDTLYVVHGSHPVRKITRSSHTAWTLTTPTINTGPFRTINGNRDLTITPTFPTATITGATQANPCVLTVSSHTFAVGETITISGVSGMTQLNGNSYEITAQTATTLTIDVDSSGFTAYSSGGSAVVAATAWDTYQVGAIVTLTAASALFDNNHVGSIFRLNEEGDVNGIPGASVGDGSFSIANGASYTNAGNVYGIANLTNNGTPNSPWNWGRWNRVPEHDSGVVRLYGYDTSGTTEDTYMDSYFLHPGYCIVKITAVSSSTVATAQIVRYQMPKSVADSGTSFWEEGAWSDYRGYPKSIAFYEQRLFFGGSSSEPTALWGSKSGAYEDFTDGSDDDDAIVYRLASGRADVIRWLESGRVLTAGTSAGEFAIAASNQNEALTPTNFKVTPQTGFGTSDAPPLRINQSVLYPQRSGRSSNAARKLREFSYAFDQDAFNSVDVSVFSEHIFGDGFDRLAYQLEPDSIIHARRTDGAIASCTYERTQEVVAWHRHLLGGTDTVVKMLTVIPGTTGDELWLSVARTVNGGTVRYIELLQPAFEDDDAKADAFFVDSGLTYSGASTSTITGLWHLRGEAVKVLSAGNVETGTVSSTGTLTLTNATTKAHIGLAYTAILETQDFEAGAQAGTAQGRAKRISEIYVRVLNSLGGTYGPDASTQKAIHYRTGADVHGSSPPLKSDMIRLDFPGGWERWARVRLEHSDPLPFHVTGITAELNVTG